MAQATEGDNCDRERRHTERSLAHAVEAQLLSQYLFTASFRPETDIRDIGDAISNLVRFRLYKLTRGFKTISRLGPEYMCLMSPEARRVRDDVDGMEGRHEPFIVDEQRENYPKLDLVVAELVQWGQVYPDEGVLNLLIPGEDLKSVYGDYQPPFPIDMFEQMAELAIKVEKQEHGISS